MRENEGQIAENNVSTIVLDSTSTNFTRGKVTSTTIAIAALAILWGTQSIHHSCYHHY